MNVKYRWFALLVLAITASVWAQKPQDPTPDQNQGPPRSDIESSSNDTKIDTRAPANDAKEHPDSDVDDVMEFHPFDPHKAMKDIEVGDYYYRRENYRAAVSRYEEALHYKPKDADATFKLAQAYEKLKKFDDAREYYSSYLSIIHDGKTAEEARKALERLPKESSAEPKK